MRFTLDFLPTVTIDLISDRAIDVPVISGQNRPILSPHEDLEEDERQR
jgi:hypothetical protein